MIFASTRDFGLLTNIGRELLKDIVEKRSYTINLV